MFTSSSPILSLRGQLSTLPNAPFPLFSHVVSLMSCAMLDVAVSTIRLERFELGQSIVFPLPHFHQVRRKARRRRKFFFWPHTLPYVTFSALFIRNGPIPLCPPLPPFPQFPTFFPLSGWGEFLRETIFHVAYPKFLCGSSIYGECDYYYYYCA